MSSFRDLPDDMLTEVFGSLPAMSILACRKVCRKWYNLSKARPVWVTAYIQTQHMLRPIVDLTEISVSRLERIMAGAEKLDRNWSNEAALHSTRPRLYRSRNSGQRTPITVMGGYIVFRNDYDYNVLYQWVSKYDAAEGIAVFEYMTSLNMVDSDHYMDYASGIFCMIFSSRSTEEPVQVIEIELDTEHLRPLLSNSFCIKLEGDRSIDYMKVNDRYACFHIYDQEFGLGAPSTSVDILDLRTKQVFQVFLSHPPAFPENMYSKTIHISDTYFMLVINHVYFSLYRRQDPCNRKDSTCGPLWQPTIFSSGVFPSVFRDGGYLVPTSSFVVIGFGEDDFPFQSPSRIYFLSSEEPDTQDCVTNEYIEIFGSTRKQTFAIPHPPNTCYTLGMASTTKFIPRSGGGTWTKDIHNHFYAIRFEVFDPQRTLTADCIQATKMDLTPWLEEGEDDMHVVDFNPFSGVALLAGTRAPEVGPGFQPILVLDFLGNN